MRHDEGQSTLEVAIVIAAVALAMAAMQPYVTRAFNGMAAATERELNGATEENRP